MTVRERILMLRLMEKQEKQPEYIDYLGIETGIVLKKLLKKEVKNV